MLGWLGMQMNTIRSRLNSGGGKHRKSPQSPRESSPRALNPDGAAVAGEEGLTVEAAEPAVGKWRWGGRRCLGGWLRLLAGWQRGGWSMAVDRKSVV